MTAADIHRTILAVWRIEQPRLITSLSRMLRDVPLAEDLTQEALLAALEHLARHGRSGKARRVADGDGQAPGAGSSAPPAACSRASTRCWRAIWSRSSRPCPISDAALDDDIGDELLRLIFTACHPRLSREARAALALRMICGLTTEEIARAFLLPEATIAQRIVRAKRTLSESGLAYETPRGEELSRAARLGAGGRLSHLQRRLYRGARRRMAAAAALQRRAADGPRADLDRAPGIRSAWPAGADGVERLAHRGAHRCGRRAHSADGPEPRAVGPACRSGAACWRLARARELGGAGGFYALQAAIVACHAKQQVRPTRPTGREYRNSTPNWRRWCDRRSSSSTARWRSAWPRVPQAALAIVDRLCREPALKAYHLLAERSRRSAAKTWPSGGSTCCVRSGGRPRRQQARAGIVEAACDRGGARPVREVRIRHTRVVARAMTPKRSMQ